MFTANLNPIPNPSKLFTHNWTLTLPTHPDLQFIHVTPSNLISLIQIFSNPLNAAYAPTSSPAWTPADTESYTTRFLPAFRAAKSKHNYLQLLILSLPDQQPLGMGQVKELDGVPGIGNLGIILNAETRGKGVGKATVEVLLRLSNECDVDVVEAGTMKWNMGMRGVMKKLGVEEREEMKWFDEEEGKEKRLVAEIMFGEKGKGIERERWRGLDVRVEFGEETE
jgi:RimJ/RimL family protein N-acetyltransferase